MEVTNKQSPVYHFLHSQLFIAFCAVAMMEQTYLQLEKPMALDRLSLFVGSATLFTYLLQRQIAIGRLGNKVATPLMIYLRQHTRLVYFLLAIALLGMGYGFAGIDAGLYPLLVVIGIISLAYDIPLGRRRLRTTGLLKLFLIAFVWGSVTVLMPAVHVGKSITDAGIWVLWLERSLFILAITLPFDLRDVLIDKMVQVDTIPARIGPKATIALATTLLGGSWLLEVIRMFFFHHTALLLWQPLVGISVSLGITGWLIVRKPTIDDDLYFFGLLDGSMLLQWLLVWMSVTLLPSVPW